MKVTFLLNPMTQTTKETKKEERYTSEESWEFVNKLAYNLHNNLTGKEFILLLKWNRHLTNALYEIGQKQYPRFRESHLPDEIRFSKEPLENNV